MEMAGKKKTSSFKSYEEYINKKSNENSGTNVENDNEEVFI